MEPGRDTHLPEHIPLPNQLNDGQSQHAGQLPAETSGSTMQRNDLQIREDPAKQETLDGTYKVRNKDYKKFFRAGRIFSTVWSEGVGGTSDIDHCTIYPAAYGERVHSVVRRFIVIRQHDRFCTCLPISPYRPTSKPSSLGDYGVIYSQKIPKTIEGITKKPVRVDLAKSIGPFRDTLVNYARTYTVEMNVKVKDVGELDSESKRVLGLNFREAFASTIDVEQTLPEPELFPAAQANAIDPDQPAHSETQSFAPSSDHIQAHTDYTPLQNATQNATQNISEDVSNTNMPPLALPKTLMLLQSDEVNKAAIPSSEHFEQLDHRFSIVGRPRRFFKTGRVFKTLWTEPAGYTAKDMNSSFYVRVKFGEFAFSKIRRFVVVRERNNSCLCLPLYTYSGQGTAKSDARAQDHAAAYAIGSAPADREDYLPPHLLRDENLDKAPFPIIVEERDEYIDPMTRINFGQVFTIQHNLTIARIGRIPDSHLAVLNQYFLESIVGQPSETPKDVVEDTRLSDLVLS